MATFEDTIRAEHHDGHFSRLAELREFPEQLRRAHVGQRRAHQYAVERVLLQGFERLLPGAGRGDLQAIAHQRADNALSLRIIATGDEQPADFTLDELACPGERLLLVPPPPTRLVRADGERRQPLLLVLAYPF